MTSTPLRGAKTRRYLLVIYARGWTPSGVAQHVLVKLPGCSVEREPEASRVSGLYHVQVTTPFGVLVHLFNWYRNKSMTPGSLTHFAEMHTPRVVHPATPEVT